MCLLDSRLIGRTRAHATRRIKIIIIPHATNGTHTHTQRIYRHRYRRTVSDTNYVIVPSTLARDSLSPIRLLCFFLLLLFYFHIWWFAFANISHPLHLRRIKAKGIQTVCVLKQDRIAAYSARIVFSILALAHSSLFFWLFV